MSDRIPPAVNHVVAWREIGGRAYVDGSDLLSALDREIIAANQHLQRTTDAEERAGVAGMIVAQERWRTIIEAGRDNLLRKAGLLS